MATTFVEVELLGEPPGESRLITSPVRFILPRDELYDMPLPIPSTELYTLPTIFASVTTAPAATKPAVETE